MISPLKRRLLLVRWWMFHMNRRQLRRWLYQVTRPASEPYISGDGFRRMAKHVYDETSRRLSPRRISDGDIVFVCTDYIQEFFQLIEPATRARYKLITHNSIIPVDEKLVSLLPDNVIGWYAKNNTFSHPKVVPIPLGLENLWRYHVGIPQDYDQMRGFSGRRKNRILSGFTVATNPGERQSVADLASRAPCVDGIAGRLSQKDYLRALVAYRFLLSPPGSGLDTNRVWEAMYLGVVPIVKDSVAMRSFERRGMPLWIIGDWRELLSLREQDLQTKYEELRSRFGAPSLFMDYWRTLILGGDVPTKGGAATWQGRSPSGQPRLSD